MDLLARARPLKADGWSGREAEWLALVCGVAGGVFTRGQYCERYGCRRNAARRLVVRLAAAGLAREYPRPGAPTNGRFCHVRAARVYRALGLEPPRARVPAGEQLWRLLLGLDYAAAHPEQGWIPTLEQGTYFRSLDLDPEMLPRRLYRGALVPTEREFPMGYPIAADAGRMTFVYPDPGFATDRPLRYWARAHVRLWTALRKTGVAVHVVAVTRNGMAARQHEALLARRVGPVAEGAELNVHERALLDALALAHETGDLKPLDRWAGWLEAGRTGERLKRRQEAAAKGGGWMDGFDTHVAITLDAGSV